MPARRDASDGRVPEDEGRVWSIAVDRGCHEMESRRRSRSLVGRVRTVPKKLVVNDWLMQDASQPLASPVRLLRISASPLPRFRYDLDVLMSSVLSLRKICCR